VSKLELVQELVIVSVQELQQAAEEEPRLLKEPVTVSMQELVQGVEDKLKVVRELVVPASRALQLQDWSSTSPHLE
jgi:hypothetical protein